VHERDRNPDAISPPRALSPPAARAHALTLHASGEIKTQPSTLRWTEKPSKNHRDLTDECPAASPRGVPLSVEAKGAGRTAIFASEFVRFTERCDILLENF